MGMKMLLFVNMMDVTKWRPRATAWYAPRRESIRQGLDLTDINDLASFFQKLLLARAKLKAGSKIELHSKIPVPVESA